MVSFTFFLLFYSGFCFAEVNVGEKAPEINAEQWINSESLSLEKIEEKVVVLEFWAKWCGPCKTSIPHLNELYNKYGEAVFISLTDENKEQKNLDEFVEEMGMQYPVGTGSTTAQTYGVRSIPHAFIIDKNRTVIWRGHPLDPEFERTLEEAIGGTASVSNNTEKSLNPSMELTEIGKGEEISGVLEEGDMVIDEKYIDGYQFRGKAGDYIRISHMSPDFDSFLRLITSDGRELVNDDAGKALRLPSEYDSGLTYQFYGKDTLTIYVASYDSIEDGGKGNYTLSVENASGTPPQNYEQNYRLPLNASIRSALTIRDQQIEGKYADSYTFSITKPDTQVLVSFTSGFFDCILMVKSPTGKVYENDDVEDGNTNSELRVMCRETGIYTIIATSYAENAGGDYYLTLENRGDVEVLLDENGILNTDSQKMITGKYYNVHTFNGSSGENVVLDVSSTEFDTYIYLKDPNGTNIEENDDGGQDSNSRINVTLPEDGEYSIVVTSYDKEALGEYTVQVSR